MQENDKKFDKESLDWLSPEFSRLFSSVLARTAGTTEAQDNPSLWDKAQLCKILSARKRVNRDQLLSTVQNLGDIPWSQEITEVFKKLFPALQRSHLRGKSQNVCCIPLSFAVMLSHSQSHCQRQLLGYFFSWWARHHSWCLNRRCGGRCPHWGLCPSSWGHSSGSMGWEGASSLSLPLPSSALLPQTQL